VESWAGDLCPGPAVGDVSWRIRCFFLLTILFLIISLNLFLQIHTTPHHTSLSIRYLHTHPSASHDFIFSCSLSTHLPCLNTKGARGKAGSLDRSEASLPGLVAEAQPPIGSRSSGIRWGTNHHVLLPRTPADIKRAFSC